MLQQTCTIAPAANWGSQHECKHECGAAYLAGEAYVWICHPPDGLHLLIDLVIRPVKTPHEVRNDQRGTAGDALRAVDQNLAIARPGSLQSSADVGQAVCYRVWLKQHYLTAQHTAPAST